MGAPVPETNAVEDVTVETLLGSLRTIDPGERRKHASVYNYWLSIKTDREFPPIRDLDPLETAISSSSASREYIPKGVSVLAMRMRRLPGLIHRSCEVPHYAYRGGDGESAGSHRGVSRACPM